MTKSDDFLAKVLKAEEEAASIVKNAKLEKIRNLKKFEEELVKSKAEKLEAEREKTKNALKAKQLEARGAYEKKIENGDREIKTLVKDLEPMIEKQIIVAQTFFLNEILG